MADSSANTDRTALATMKRKDGLKGKVLKIGLSGALVDVGAEREGLLHISALGKEDVNRVEDVLQVGQDVEVWVRKVDAEKVELQLTMVKPLAFDWNDLRAGETVQGKVTRVEKFGAFVDFGAERPGLIHVSELSIDYVKDPSEIVKVGDEVEATILEINRKKKQIHLSKKALEAAEMKAVEAVAEETPEEKPVTSMEAAFLKAQSTSKSDALQGKKGSLKYATEEKRLQQEEIMMRTLQTAARK